MTEYQAGLERLKREDRMKWLIWNEAYLLDDEVRGDLPRSMRRALRQLAHYDPEATEALRHLSLTAERILGEEGL